MTKQAKIQPQSQPKPHSRQMKLRSNGPLVPESVKIVTSIKKSSLIGDKELDEMKIIREFQMKRKLLMKILKQKQKLKSSGSTPIDPFQIKEGILQIYDSESHQQDSPFPNQNTQILTLQQQLPTDHEVNPDSLKQNTEPVSIDSEKVDAAIQTDKDLSKKEMVLRSVRETSNKIPTVQKKISKEGAQTKVKKTKKTKEDIQRIKNQITSLFVAKQSEHQSSPQSSGQCQSLISSFLGSTDEQCFAQVSFIIKKLNNEIEVFYTGRYLMDVILDQYKQNYNRKRTYNSEGTSQLSSNQSSLGNKSIELDRFQIGDRKMNIDAKPQPVKPSIHPIEEEKTQKILNEQTNNSGSSKKSKRKARPNKGILNDRFQILVQSSQRPIKNQTPKNQSPDNIKHESVPNKNQVLKDQTDDQALIKSRQMMVEELSETESQIHDSKAWIKEFDMQVQLIYEKYPRLRKYQLSRKILNHENKQIQIDQIENFCAKKSKKIVKKSRLLNRKKQPKPKTFKEMVQTISNGKANSQYRPSQTQQKNKANIKCKKKAQKLKEIEIGHQQEEEFCKSFDHRSQKGKKFVQSQLSQILSQDLKDNQFYNHIYDVLGDFNDNNKSHQFYFSSASSNGFNDSLERNSAKLENKKGQISRSMSKSHVGTSSEVSGQRKNIIFGKSIERSLFKSEQGQDYFNMSGDNPLDF